MPASAPPNRETRPRCANAPSFSSNGPSDPVGGDKAGDPWQRVDEHEPFDTLRVLRGEQLRHQATLGHASEGHPLEPGSVEHGEDVLRPPLERRGRGEPVRQPDPPLVERDHSEVAPQVLQEPSVVLVFPGELDVGDEWGDDEDFRPVPELLPGDGHITRVGESHLRHIHTPSLTPRGCSWNGDGAVMRLA
jgi:hypothetical protein